MKKFFATIILVLSVVFVSAQSHYRFCSRSTVSVGTPAYIIQQHYEDLANSQTRWAPEEGVVFREEYNYVQALSDGAYHLYRVMGWAKPANQLDVYRHMATLMSPAGVNGYRLEVGQLPGAVFETQGLNPTTLKPEWLGYERRPVAGEEFLYLTEIATGHRVCIVFTTRCFQPCWASFIPQPAAPTQQVALPTVEPPAPQPTVPQPNQTTQVVERIVHVPVSSNQDGGTRVLNLSFGNGNTYASSAAVQYPAVVNQRQVFNQPRPVHRPTYNSRPQYRYSPQYRRASSPRPSAPQGYRNYSPNWRPGMRSGTAGTYGPARSSSVSNVRQRTTTQGGFRGSF